MKFDLSEDQALLQQSTRDFLTSELPLEKSRNVMEHSPEGYDPAEWRRLAEMGYLGLTLPASGGGQELGAIELAIVVEQMGRVCAPGPYLDAMVAAAALVEAGKQDALLADVAAGKKLVVLARHDSPFAGGESPQVRFEKGRVRGTKYFVPFAAGADALVVTTPEGRGDAARDLRSVAALR
jgi:alkylation response protein AidB-like acyl-CoA dehydrogenase